MTRSGGHHSSVSSPGYTVKAPVGSGTFSHFLFLILFDLIYRFLSVHLIQWVAGRLLGPDI